eukprot:TRINITY_DN6123_c0_g2_i1.p1 TRINITY_DN6123_c0_g2~~TRINITY_DN6123_c0_g2_i1.p1  ORF type:complete len:404 (-),score=66.60 TRINITY_DN6123_c0_g2_i1:57-1268(-)
MRIPFDSNPLLVTEDAFKRFLEREKQLTDESKKRSSILFSKDKSTPTLSIEDFTPLRVIGKGSLGNIILIEKNDTKELFAKKSIRRDDPDLNEFAKTEKVILEHINHPFLVNLEFSFVTPEAYLFVTKFMKGGEIFQHLRRERRFPEQRVRFYAAQITLALGYLHSKDIIYRDLKPENVVMDEIGYIASTDFGLSKMIKRDSSPDSFIGTPEYIAPETIKGEGQTRETDWWTLGVLLYEMLVGIPPFYHQNQNTMFQLVTDADCKFPSQIPISGDCVDLIVKLLAKDPKKRIGSVNDVDDIKSHSWFKDMDWDAIMKKKIQAPFVPFFVSEMGLDYFDDDFLSEDPIPKQINIETPRVQHNNQEIALSRRIKEESYTEEPYIPRGCFEITVIFFILFLSLIHI